ncbi:hypothetical protein DFH06DRAFT_1470668 [Mycena polygramma]|nr:hypothetical protein DFH06DRAFT_1470668 [Mycena polygramma]
MPPRSPVLSSEEIESEKATNEYLFRDLVGRHQSIDTVDVGSLFLELILGRLFLEAGRPVDDDITSLFTGIALLRNKPELFETLKVAHAEKDYTRVAQSPLIPPFVSTAARAYLDSLRPHMEKLVNGEKTLDTWIPDSDVPVDDDTLRHIKSLKLCRLYRDGLHQRDFSIILHDLGGFKNDPVLNARTTEIFTRQNKFLVNTSGSGKTRLLYEGLCLNWGLFFTFVVDSGYLGAGDIQKALKDMFKSALGFEKKPTAPAADIPQIMKQNSEYFFDIFSTLLLARLLIFQVFLEVASASGLTEEHKKRWLMMQLSPELLNPRPDGVFGYSAFDVLPQILAREDTDYVRENIADALRKIRKLLGDASPLFIVLDEAQTAVTKFAEAFASTKPRPSLLTELMRVWGSHTTEDDTFIFAGTDIPKSLFEGVEDSGYVWCSGTGAFEPEAQERYVSSFLPPTFSASPSGILLISRISRWLAGRHRWTASFIQALIREGFKTPHTRFNAYISNVTGLKPLDDFEKVQAQVKAEACDPEKSWRKTFSIVTFSEMPTDFRPLFLDILVRYMATHHGSPAFGPEYISLVNEGYGRCTDAELSHILVDEPLVLVGVARALLPDPRSRPAVEKYIPGHPNNYPETFVGSMRLNVPRTPRVFSHWLVFYLARLFGQPRNVTDVFNFPHKPPAWANQSAQLATFHPTGTEAREFGYSIVSSDDASEERRPPLAIEAASLEETLSWLAHDSGTPFCLPFPSSTTPDLLFSLMLADGTSILVALRAMVSTDPVPDSELQAAVSQLRPESLFMDEDDPSVHSRAIATVQDMPFRSSKLGKYGLLRVVSSFPAEVDLKGCVPKSSRDVASLSLTAFEDEVTQPEFFNSVVNGILAGSKRKSEAAPESSSKRHKSVDAKAEESPAPEVPVTPKKKRAGKSRAKSPPPPNATVTRRGSVKRKPEIPPEDLPAKGGKAKAVPPSSSTPVSRNTRSRTKAADKRKGQA